MKEYFDTVTRVGAEGHCFTDEEYDELMETGRWDDGNTPARQGDDMLHLGQARELLL